MYTQPLNHWNHTVFIDNAKQQMTSISLEEIYIWMLRWYTPDTWCILLTLGVKNTSRLKQPWLPTSVKSGRGLWLIKTPG